MRLIDADALLMERKMSKYYHLPNGDIAIPVIDIEHAPTVDAVPVVRCRDCEHYNAGFECLIEGYGIERDSEWYCGDGERRGE